MNTSIRLYLLCVLFSLPLISSASNGKWSEELNKLDESLFQKSVYEQRKLDEIKALKRNLRTASQTDKFKINRMLFDQYSSYQYDSAYVYANHLLSQALKERNCDYELEARCDIVFCLLSAGLYTEAFNELATIRLEGTNQQSRKLYFKMASRLYYDVSDYTKTEPYQSQYIKQGSVYTDSLLHYIQKDSPEWYYAVGIKEMKEHNFAASLDYFNQYMEQKGGDVHSKAIVTSCLGWLYLYQKDLNKAIKYLAQAAIYDNKGVVRETTALCTLARLLYKEGDIQHATEYVRQSLSNANFYGARQRVIEVSSILPIIERDRYNIMQGQRNAIAVAAVVFILFVIGLFVAWCYIRKQMMELKKAQVIIDRRNKQLETKNNQLEEVNKIKDEYIGRSFYINSEYINKVEKLYRTIDRKLMTRRIEDLRSSLKESELIAERKSMFVDFDETFLKLFPHFIEKYNELFDNPDSKCLDPKQLTTEMRIFALIRLGITDSERIATFLNYSVHTINTYKTRVKNRSHIDNDKFEGYIMKI